MFEKLETLDMDPAFLGRYVNDGFSGGEKKRLEMLQMTMLAPKYAVLDETDSGLDVDALRAVGAASARCARATGRETGFLVITHYPRILQHVPDGVHVMIDGRIVKSRQRGTRRRNRARRLRRRPRRGRRWPCLAHRDAPPRVRSRAATLDAAIAYLAERGNAHDAALRREALARFDELPAPGARPCRGWKYDYAKLPTRVRVDVGPRRAAGDAVAARRAPRASADEAGEVDRPALATENAGGLYHLGATFVERRGNVDPRVTLLPLDAPTARDFAAQLKPALHHIVDWRATGSPRSRPRFATAARSCTCLRASSSICRSN